LQRLWPNDWRILYAYLKFMVQHKGEKAMWWPFLQGVPGNGKSFISDTMEYCIGKKFTQRPTPKNLDSNFNASLYGCLFVAFEDVKLRDDHGSLWETLKPMITQTRIEIEPKGTDKVTREICFNGLLNSNHKDGIRKEPDDRRICPFFAKQQRERDLARDGLNNEYFTRLWDWAMEQDGWAYVAYHLATDPIEDRYNPHTRAKIAPVTTSTAEAIEYGLSPIEQALFWALRDNQEGFRNGWINETKFDALIAQAVRGKTISKLKRADILRAFGYEPHPHLPAGKLRTALPDGSGFGPLWVAEGRDNAESDPEKIRALYIAAQKG